MDIRYSFLKANDGKETMKVQCWHTFQNHRFLPQLLSAQLHIRVPPLTTRTKKANINNHSKKEKKIKINSSNTPDVEPRPLHAVDMPQLHNQHPSLYSRPRKCSILQLCHAYKLNIFVSQYLEQPSDEQVNKYTKHCKQ